MFSHRWYYTYRRFLNPAKPDPVKGEFGAELLFFFLTLLIASIHTAARGTRSVATWFDPRRQPLSPKHAGSYCQLFIF
jgi:hypothetical protein